MLAWENLFKERICRVRGRELQSLAVIKYLDAICVYCWATTPILFSLLTFSLYALMGNTLTAATVFTSLSLFNVLLAPLNSFPWVINGTVEAWVSIKRLQRFLACPHTEVPWTPWEEAEAEKERGEGATDGSDASISITGGAFSWAGRRQVVLGQSQQAVLQGVDLVVPRGALVVVHGEVAAGKSSLLAAILGDMVLLSGQVAVHGRTTYVPQVPWIHSGTVRENIVFGNKWEPQRYESVLTACDLKVDFDHMAPLGDQSEVGENGVGLSGGQKARVAIFSICLRLADRALYQRSEVVLLDDPLSAVDAEVVQHLLMSAISGPLMAGRTCVLCTHNQQVQVMAHVLVNISQGRVTSHTLNALSSRSQVSAPLEEIWMEIQQPIRGEKELAEEEGEGERVPLIGREEGRKSGKIEGKVYWRYIKANGQATAVVLFASLAIMQATRNGSDLWLSHWVDTPSNRERVWFNLSILLCLGLANSLSTLSRAFAFAVGGLRAATCLHDDLLASLLAAPLCFFHSPPPTSSSSSASSASSSSVGPILNRLSSDAATVDDSLPFIANILLAQTASLAGLLVVLLLVCQWGTLLLLPPIAGAFLEASRRYRASSRELRRLENASKSPIYSLFSEALEGGPTLRAFRAQGRFGQLGERHVARNQRAAHAELAVGQWLALRLQLVAAAVVSFVGFSAVLGAGRGGGGTAGSLGLGLSYALPLVSLLSSLLTSFTETEKEMVAVERMQEYSELPPEEEGGDQEVGGDARDGAGGSWLLEGSIEFEQVSMQYKPELPLVLANVSFVIKSGEHVGIAGRTGAGKSSVLNALFRLQELCGGRVFVSGHDIRYIPLFKLRTSLSIIPQNPFLFEGTARENVDPFGSHSDGQIWDMLGMCRLKETVKKLGGLDFRIEESGGSLSMGERQLLCLARALLERKKVLCLDECTANVDVDTSSILGEVVNDLCSGVTVVTIAHRVETLNSLARILVLDRGVLVEDCSSLKLLKATSSHCFPVCERKVN